MILYAIVDYEYDFVAGALGFPGAERLDAGIVQCGQKTLAEDEQAVVVEVKDTHSRDYLNTREGRALPIIHSVPGTPGWETYGETGAWLAKTPHITIQKSTFGCPPEEMLNLPDGVTEIRLVGLVTNMCDLAVACTFQARYPEAQIVVYADLCDSFNKELHSKALDVMAGLQMKVVNFKEELNDAC